MDLALLPKLGKWMDLSIIILPFKTLESHCWRRAWGYTEFAAAGRISSQIDNTNQG
jgi:hypothetical protein